MDNLPFELLTHILKLAALSGYKNDALDLRLVCRTFDAILKPVLCRTLNLELTRLSKLSLKKHPTSDALQTIGCHCTSLYVDLMLLRDEGEVEFLKDIFTPVPSMTEYCNTLQTRYCMHEKSFTEADFRDKVEELLFYCRGVDRLRLNLPFPLVGAHCTAVTMVLANTLAALKYRPEEDSAALKVLAIDNLTDITLCSLWANPIDVGNARSVFQGLEHLGLSIKRREHREAIDARFEAFGQALWGLIAAAAGSLRTLCLVGLDRDFRSSMSVRSTLSDAVNIHLWRPRALPNPTSRLLKLACLELKKTEIRADFFSALSASCRETLTELYLGDVYLKVCAGGGQHASTALWVGIPNVAPGAHDTWVAATVRALLPNIRVCRATRLGYDFHGTRQELADCGDFDLNDPCGRERILGRRFVEVVAGYEQPPLESGEPCAFLPAGNAAANPDPEAPKPWRKHMRPSEWDVIAYQTLVNNTTSAWMESIDGNFPNCNTGTLDELHAIGQTACAGMSKVTEQRERMTESILTINTNAAGNGSQGVAGANGGAIQPSAEAGNGAAAHQGAGQAQWIAAPTQGAGDIGTDHDA